MISSELKFFNGNDFMCFSLITRITYVHCESNESNNILKYKEESKAFGL